MSLTTRTIEVNGRRLFYRERREDEEAPTVVLIHGNTASSLWFDRAMRLIQMNTVAPDLPNFGGSEPIEESDINRYAQAVEGFIRAAVGKVPIYLVGHSLGGAVAMSLALSLGQQLRGMILLDSCAPTGLQTPEEYYPIIEQYATNRELLRGALATVVPHLEDEALFESLVEEAMKMQRASFTGNARSLARFDVSGRTREVEIPVLVLRGEEDALITDAMARETSAAFPHACLETLAGVGHSLVVEDPERFAQVVQRFIEANRG